jgi:hypothetical protein
MELGLFRRCFLQATDLQSAVLQSVCVARPQAVQAKRAGRAFAPQAGNIWPNVPGPWSTSTAIKRRGLTQQST